MPVITAPFAHDQTLRGTDAPCSSVNGNRFIQDKIGSHFKGLLDTRTAVHYCKGNAAPV